MNLDLDKIVKANSPLTQAKELNMSEAEAFIRKIPKHLSGVTYKTWKFRAQKLPTAVRNEVLEVLEERNPAKKPSTHKEPDEVFVRNIPPDQDDDMFSDDEYPEQ